MARITVTRTINAPAEQVFKTVSEIENYSQAVTDILSTEIISDVKVGVGTRFKETRKMGGKEASTVLEVKEYVENDRVRLVADEGGTIWDSVFILKPSGDATELTLSMDAKSYKLLPKIMNPMAKSFMKKALERDMNAVKAYCEK